jgi:hypothetical protein
LGHIGMPPWAGLEALAEVTHIQSYPYSKSPFGAIRAAWLRITGWTRKAVVRLHGSGTEWRWLGIRKSSFRPDIECGHLSEEGTYTGYLGEVWLLLIAYGGGYEEINRHCLVLIKSNKQQGAFERIGTAEVWGKDKGRWKRKNMIIV